MKKFYNLFLLLIIITACIVGGCASSKCPNCTEQDRGGPNKKPVWNVALHSPVIDKCANKQVLSVTSEIKPVFMPIGRKTKCDKIEWEGVSFKDYIKDKKISELNGVVHVVATECAGGGAYDYDIPAANILEITDMSDPLRPPKDWIPDEPCVCCGRERNGLWFFDKFEIRAMGGYRGKQDPAQIFLNGTRYEPKIFGTDINGSNIFAGLEIAGMWSLESSKAFQLGFMTGLWPVDGSYFVPLSIHPRYTFNQIPNPYKNNCDALYFYGDLGMAFDFETTAPIDAKRLFYGIGVGYEWAISCGIDFSVDIGIRQMNLPLPPIDCCPDVPKEDRFYYRKSTAGILRFGLTF